MGAGGKEAVEQEQPGNQVSEGEDHAGLHDLALNDWLEDGYLHPCFSAENTSSSSPQSPDGDTEYGNSPLVAEPTQVRHEAPGFTETKLAPGESSCQAASAGGFNPMSSVENYLGASSCWGGHLQGTSAYCVPGFNCDGGRFKNKFCQSCLRGISITADRVWMITPELRRVLKNCKAAGFWSSVSRTEFRVINNTLNAGPALAVFRSLPSALTLPVADAWLPIPDHWVHNGQLFLTVAKGTLVPTRPVLCHGPAPVGYWKSEEPLACPPKAFPETKTEVTACNIQTHKRKVRCPQALCLPSLFSGTLPSLLLCVGRRGAVCVCVGVGCRAGRG